MNLNNKGFAITGILYTILVMFLLLLSSLLALLSSRINRLITLVDNINSEIEYRNIIDIEAINSDDDGNKSGISNPINTNEFYITTYMGKYEFTINDNNTNKCYAYLPKDTLVTIQSGIIKYKRPEIMGDISIVNSSNLTNSIELSIIGCTNTGVNKVELLKIYTSQEE